MAATRQAGRRSGPSATVYHTLAEINELGIDRSNLYAAVADTSAPARTRGTDWKVTLTLQDRSQPEGVTLVLFAHSVALLPGAEVGSIIRVHRAHLKRYNGMPQLSGKVNSPLQWCLYDAAPGSPTDPREASSDNYSTPPDHTARLEAARQDAAGRVWARPGQDMYLKRAEELLPADLVAPNAHDFHADIVCRVLAVQDPPEEPEQPPPEAPGAAAGVVAAAGEAAGAASHQQAPHVQRPPILWVWDATDTCPFYIPPGHPAHPYSAGQQTPWHRPLPLREDPPRGLHVSPGLPPIGTVLTVVAHNRTKQEMPQLGVGPLWVKLRNVNVKAEPSGHVCIHYTSSSRWSKVAPCEAAVKRLAQRQQAGAVADWADTSFLRTKLPRPHTLRPYTTMRAIHLSAPDAQPGKFRCLARVAGYWPADVRDFCSRWEPEGGGEPEWVWTVKLLLEDATAQLEVLLWAEDAGRFFGGVGLRPCNLWANPQVAGRLQALMDGFCQGQGGDREAVAWRSPPWIECCVLSYFLERSRPEETVRYRMFDTAACEPQQQQQQQQQREPSTLPSSGAAAAAAAPRQQQGVPQHRSNAFRFM